MKNLFLIFLFIGLSTTGSAELFDMNRVSVRAMGMGNAYTAIVRDADSLFYNPAGLAQVGGVNWTIFDIVGGLSNIAKASEAAELAGGDPYDAIDALYGEQVWIGGHAKTAVTLPLFSAALYGTSDVSVSVNNPAVPELHANVLYDYGIAAGTAFPLIPGLHFGAVVKSITRTGTRQTYGVTSLGTLDFDAISDSFNDGGQAFSLDAGMNIMVESPITPVFSLVYRNIGVTSFRTTSDALPDDKDEIIAGAALIIDTPVLSISPAIDVRYLNQTGIDLARKINLGVEVDLPMVDLRAGLHQGYLSYGAGLSLGLIRVEAASYGVELGEYAGQLEDRRYVVQFTMELGFDLGLNFSGTGDGGNGSRGGIFGTRLKQRR